MTDEQTARKIVSDAQYDGELNDDVSHEKLEAAIVRALQQARSEAGRDGVVAGHMTRKAPPGHIIDDAGVVRRVKSYDTLDGRIWEEWHKRHEVEPITLEQVHAAGLRLPDGFTDAADFIKHTRGQGEAAEAAKEAK